MDVIHLSDSLKLFKGHLKAAECNILNKCN